MAIYNNREVDLISTPRITHQLPETVQVQDKQGNVWNLKSTDVKFTDEELKAMQVDKEDPKDTFKKASKEDIEAAKVGVAPVADLIPAAQTQVTTEKRDEILKKNTEAAKKEAEKIQKDKTETTYQAPKAK